MTTDHLNPRQQAFCRFYGDPRSDVFGNGTQAYLRAYKGVSKDSARRSASDLLGKQYIAAEIKKAMEFGEISDAFVDEQLYLLIKQNGDLSAKLGVIQEYNKLRLRLSKKSRITIQGPIVYIPEKLHA